MAVTGIDKALADALKRARKAPAAKPYFFALVLKGGASGKLIVSKKKIPPKQVEAAKKETGGSAVVKGVCYGGAGDEAGMLVFETPKVPAPACAKVAKLSAKDHAGLAIKPAFRIGRDDEQVAESDAPDEPLTDADDEADEVAEPDPAVAAAEAAAAAAWRQRVDAVTARVKVAAAAKNPAARDMVLGISQAGAFFRGGQPVEAEARLKQVEALLGSAPPAAPPAPPAPPPGTDPAAEWKAKLAEAQPVIKAALAANPPTAGDIKRLFAQAMALSKPGGIMAEALAKLAECHNLAKAAVGIGIPKAPPPPPGPVADVTARFKALTPGLKAALAAKGPNVGRIQALAVALNGAIKAPDYPHAGKLIDELEPLLAPPAAPAPGADPAAQWKAKLAEYQPAIKAAIAARGPDAAAIGKLLVQAMALSKPGGNSAEAVAKLTEAHALAAPPASPAPSKAPPGVAAPSAAGLAAWQAAREQVVNQIRAAAAKIEATNEPSAVPAVIELKSVISQLTANPATPGQVAELDRYLRTDDVITDAESLPSEFGTLVIRQPLLAALAALAS